VGDLDGAGRPAPGRRREAREGVGVEAVRDGARARADGVAEPEGALERLRVEDHLRRLAHHAPLERRVEPPPALARVDTEGVADPGVPEVDDQRRAGLVRHCSFDFHAISRSCQRKMAK